MPDDALPQTTFITLLDELIPERDASLPGAGSLGLGPAIAAKLGDATALVAAGLAALDKKARVGAASDFANLPSGERAPLVSEVAAEHPGFLETLIFHSYTAYYQHPRVVAAIGLTPEPPYPRGYDLEEGDLGMLDPVRKRKPMHREA